MFKREINELSIRERNLWVELLGNGFVALYFFPKLFWLLRAGDDALRGRAMVNVIVGTVMAAIFVNAALAIFLHAKQKPEPMDERDIQIDGRGSALSSRVLLFCNGVITALIVIQEMDLGQNFSWLQLSPLGIANLLLSTFMVASLSSAAMKLVLYRQGL